MADLLSNLNNFHMVGVRFSRLSVDERATSELGVSDFEVQVTNSDPELSKHLYVDRKVIEIRVSAVAVPVDGDKKSNAFAEMFNVECTAGFVGATEEFDGNLEAFSEIKNYFARSIYWVLRERLDSIFAVTVLRGSTRLPWDLAAAVEPKKTPARKTVAKVPVGKKPKRAAAV